MGSKKQLLKEKSHYFLTAALGVWLYFALSARLEDASPVFDVWLHLATLRELIYHPQNPLHPIFLISTPQKDFAPFYLIISKLSVIWGKDVLLTFKIGGILNFFLYSFFLTRFLGRIFHIDSKTKCLALLGTLFIWGSAWMWSAVYSFNTLTLTAGYPSFWGLALSLGSAYYLYEYLHQERIKDLFLSVIFFYMFFVTYPPILPFFLINAALIIAIQGDNNPRNDPAEKSIAPQIIRIPFLDFYPPKKTAFVIILFSLAVASSFWWPFFSLKSMLSGIRYTKEAAFDPLVKIKQLWPAVFAAVAAFALEDKKISAYCTTGFIIFILLALITLPLNINLWGRFLLFSLFYIQIGFAAYVGQVKKLKTRSNPIIPAILSIAFFLICAMQLIRIYQGETFKMAIPTTSYEKIGSLLGDRAVVLSDVITGWPLPAYGPKIVAHIYSTGEAGDELERRRDVSFFLSSPEKVEECGRILAKYQAQYILINKKIIKDYDKFGHFGEIAYSDGFVILMRVIR